MELLLNLLIIAIVVALFNVIIFVHELGHFLAARWRKLQVDRFQIWFGKPIWKKEINGVQYGLGWIPAGGFVALPQMAPMESIEGRNREGEEVAPLPPVKPLDKIIVAFAGPLFSFLLALLSAAIVTGVGKPKDRVETTEVGYVPEEGVAREAGFQVGDKIRKVNGVEVTGWYGSADFTSVKESVMLSEGDTIIFEVEREGVDGLVELKSKFEIPDTPWYERKGMRSVGIGFASTVVLGKPSKGGPADRAGLKDGDTIIRIGDEPIQSRERVHELVKASAGKELAVVVLRDGKEQPPFMLTPQIPTNWPKGVDERPMIGVSFAWPPPEVSETLYNPGPFEQVGDSVRMMWVTIAKIASPKSDVGFQHLSGPVGIGGAMFDMLKTENGWRRLIWFMVLFNVNLAILNMLPLPVLDGGHIVFAVGEWISGRPMKAKILEVVQVGFVIVLLSFFLFITSKDIGDRIGLSGGPKFPKEFTWPGT